MITGADKAIVAVAMSILWLLDTLWGVAVFDKVEEEFIAVNVAIMTPVFVWLVPNKET